MVQKEWDLLSEHRGRWQPDVIACQTSLSMYSRWPWLSVPLLQPISRDLHARCNPLTVRLLYSLPLQASKYSISAVAHSASAWCSVCHTQVCIFTISAPISTIELQRTLVYLYTLLWCKCKLIIGVFHRCVRLGGPSESLVTECRQHQTKMSSQLHQYIASSTSTKQTK